MRSIPKHVRRPLLACTLVLATQPGQGLARQDPDTAQSNPRQAVQRDGQHDFDFEIGTWKTRLSRRLRPLTASSCRFEQAFSDDGGKTWEVNWIATDTRVTGP